MEKSMIKNRWIFTLCLILMTLCCLSYGVYSLIKADFSASGTIEYNAYFDLDMKAEVLGSTTTISPYYATTTYQTTAKSDSTRQQYNQNDLTDTSWKLSDLIPTDLTFGSTEEIIVKLSITNYAPYPIDIDLTQLSSDSNLYTEVNNTGYIYAYNKNVTASPADTEYITIRFTPKSSSATVKKSSVNFSFKLKFSDRFEATASELTYTTSSSTATISAYTGSKETCVLPRVLTVGSTNYTPALKVGTSSAAGVTLPSTTKKLIVPGTISTISNYAFTKNTNLTDVTMCYGIKQSTNGCFSGCTNLQNVYLPEGFNTEAYNLDSYFFENCEKLANVYIPNSCNIGWSMFANTGLIDVYIPYGAYLDAFAFNSCNNLTTLRISTDMEAIDYSPVTRCKNIKTIKVASWNSIYTSGVNDDYLYDKTTNTLVAGTISANIPSTTVNISAFAFWGYTLVKSVTIPKNVSCIGGNAFKGCNALSSVEFNQRDYWIAVKNAGSSKSGFEEFSNELSGATTSANYLRETYVDYAWYTTPRDSSYFYNLTFTAISNSTNCSVAASGTTIEGAVKIPQKVAISGTNYAVTTLNANAFDSCSKITSVFVPRTISSVSNLCGFAGCSQLISIVVDSYNSTYDSRNNCNAIIQTSTNTLVSGCKTSTIPSEITKIGSSAFSWCRGLTSLVIPSSVVEIGPNAFKSCSNLATVEISGNITVIKEYAFSACKILSSVILPESLTTIGSGAFSDCSSLNSVSFESPYCWKYADTTTLSSTELKDTSTASTYLTSTYSGNTWKKVVNAATSYSNLIFTAISGTNNCNVKAKSSSISGSIVIPEMVKIDSVNYVVTEVASDAFQNCLSVTSINLPSTITAIGFHAFYCCRYVTSINIPSAVTSIGAGAFEGAERITSIVIPAATTDIATTAFRSMNRVETIVVESANTVYDSRNNCNALIETATNTLIAGAIYTSVPSSVTIIGNESFTFKQITTIELPDGVVTIGTEAFYGSSISTLVIPSSVTTIGANAFGSCGNLSSVTFGSIAGWKAGSTSLSASNIANRSTAATYLKTTYVSSIWTRDTSASGSSSDYSATFKFTIISSSAKTAMVEAASTSISGDIVIPSSVTIGSTTYSIIQVGSFSNCTGITSLKLANSITTINTSAFNGCSNIAGKIIIPESVTAVGASAFYGCSKITSVVFENPKTTIGNYAFVDCTSLTSIDLPKNLETISTGLLANCTALTALTIPAKVTKIEVEAFVTSGLKTLTIPISVTYMGYGIVNNCTNLTTVTFEMPYGWRAGSVSISPDSLANGVTAKNLLYNDYVTENWACEVTPDVFADKFIFTIISTTDKTAAVKSAEDTAKNPAVKIASGNLVIPAYIKINGVIYTVKYISDNGFEGCTNLTYISIPSTVVNIGADTFAGCTKLRGVKLAEGVQIIGSNAFKNCTALTSVRIPTSVTTISPNAFSGCINLSKVKLEIVDSSNSRLYYWQIGAGSTTVYECTLFASEENTAKMLTSTFQNSTWTLKRKNLI